MEIKATIMENELIKTKTRNVVEVSNYSLFFIPEKPLPSL